MTARAALAVAPALLAACTTSQSRPEREWVPLGRTATVGPVQVTPYAVVEDSRCPQAVRCVWQGRVRVATRLSLELREMTWGQPVPIAGGALLLAEVQPARQPEEDIAAADYRFRFTFIPAG